MQKMLEELTNTPDAPPRPALGPNHHILGETFHSMAALRFGDYVAKLSAAPFSDSVKSLTGTSIPDTDSALRDLVVDFFRSDSAVYEMRAQLLTDLEQMPVEDASVLWPESLSPHQPVGRLTFPPQDAYTPARIVYADDVLSFTPWNCIEEHRPLGCPFPRLRLAERSQPLIRVYRFHN